MLRCDALNAHTSHAARNAVCVALCSAGAKGQTCGIQLQERGVLRRLHSNNDEQDASAPVPRETWKGYMARGAHLDKLGGAAAARSGHMRPPVLGQLNGNMPDPSCARMYERPLAWT